VQDPETGEIKRCKIKCSNFIEWRNYSGTNTTDREELERYINNYNAENNTNYSINDYELVSDTEVEFKSKNVEEFIVVLNKTFENGGCVLLNTEAEEFTEEQHFIGLMGKTEENYAFFSDSSHATSKYDKSKPYSSNNLPPYLRWDYENNEPFYGRGNCKVFS